MKTTWWAPALALAAAVPAQAQVAGYKDVASGHWAAESISGLAARAVMAPQSKGAKFDGSKPVTRYELAVTLYRFAQFVERADKQKKTKDGALAPMTGPAAIKRLVAGGYLPASSPLCKDGDKTVTANQLADAISQVLTRARERTVPITPESRRSVPIDHPEHSRT